MNLLLLFLSSFLFPMTTPYAIDFGRSHDTPAWRVIDDGVMGGLSRGKIQLRENSLFFSGRVSLANNGGFSSIRGPYGKWDLSDYRRVTLRVRGNARFSLQLETSEYWYQPNFKQYFEAKEDWQVIELELRSFSPYRIGTKIREGMSQAERAQVLRLGITTAEKKAHEFELEIDYLKFE